MRSRKWLRRVLHEPLLARDLLVDMIRQLIV